MDRPALEFTEDDVTAEMIEAGTSGLITYDPIRGSDSPESVLPALFCAMLRASGLRAWSDS